MQEVIEWGILVNSGVAFIYLLIRIIMKKSPAMTLFFLFLPILGLALYGSAILSLSLFHRFHYDKDSLVRRIRLEGEENHPAIEEELNVVSITDAMAVSSLYEKRTLVLDQLRKSIMDNYRFVLDAGNDKDSESVHYVAAAKMEIYNWLQGQLDRALKLYSENPEKEANFHDLMKALDDFINSEVISDKLKEMFMEHFCDLYRNQYEKKASVLTKEEQDTYIVYLIETKKYDDAIQAFYSTTTKKGERAYFEMLEFLYEKGDQEGFYHCMDQLEKNRSVRLSSDGIEKLRYWRKREEEIHAVS